MDDGLSRGLGAVRYPGRAAAVVGRKELYAKKPWSGYRGTGILTDYLKFTRD